MPIAPKCKFKLTKVNTKIYQTGTAGRSGDAAKQRSQVDAVIATQNANRARAGRSDGTNGKGMSQLSASPTMTASPHASGGRIMTRAVSAVSSIAGPVNPRPLPMQRWQPRFAGQSRLPRSKGRWGWSVGNRRAHYYRVVTPMPHTWEASQSHRRTRLL